jgi:hypothetical protein
VKTLLEWDDKEFDKHITVTLEQLKQMIDNYFESRFNKRCNYAILHFNSGSIKANRMLECGFRKELGLEE